jgi:hypothetical protein
MKDFIDRLPIDIVLQIIPYTYNIQNKELLNDIVSYKETHSLLSELYYNYWIVYTQEEPEEDRNWLINDIIGYANNDIGTMYGHVDKFYTIFKRNIFLKTEKAIDKYVKKLDKNNVNTEINIFLGLLQANEREEFINSVKDKLTIIS